MRRKITFIIVMALVPLVLFACNEVKSLSPVPSEGLRQSLEEYQSSIDYSCNTSSDCKIKDVGNCCGYYPECVNVSAKTDPDLVKKLCQQSSMGGVCGFPSINDCQCVNNKCQGVHSN